MNIKSTDDYKTLTFIEQLCGRKPQTQPGRNFYKNIYAINVETCMNCNLDNIYSILVHKPFLFGRIRISKFLLHYSR